MWRVLGFVGVALALALTSSGDVLAQKKGGKEQSNQAKPEDYARIKDVKEVMCEVASVDSGSRTISIKLDFPEYEANPNYRPPSPTAGLTQATSLQRKLVQYQQALASPPSAGRAQRIARLALQIQQSQASLVRTAAGQAANPNSSPIKVVHHEKNFELPLQEKCVIRKMAIGKSTFDDQGNIKEFTPAEIAKLKGSDPARPGYAAKLEEIQPGSIVMLYLSPPKEDAKKAEPKKDAAKKDEAKKDDKAAADDDKSLRPTVRMIVMTKEGEMSYGERAAKKK